MNKIHQLALMGAFALALTTFSCSSDDNDDKDKGNKYLSCSEAEVIRNECYEQYISSVVSLEQLFITCVETCMGDDGNMIPSCYESCVEPTAFYECIDSNGICGNKSIKDDASCEMHYRDECDFVEEDD